MGFALDMPSLASHPGDSDAPAHLPRQVHETYRARSRALRPAGGLALAQRRRTPEYDVVLDVPNLCVNRIFLKVDSVTATINFNARAANLVRVNAGAEVLIGRVELTIEEVRAQALLERTLSAAGGVVAERTIGSVLSLPTIRETTNAAGQLVRQVRDQAGAVIEYTLDKATNQLRGIRVLQAAR